MDSDHKSRDSKHFLQPYLLSRNLSVTFQSTYSGIELATYDYELRTLTSVPLQAYSTSIYLVHVHVQWSSSYKNTRIRGNLVLKHIFITHLELIAFMYHFNIMDLSFTFVLLIIQSSISPVRTNYFF
jgi:hypothetical protein